MIHQEKEKKHSPGDLKNKKQYIFCQNVVVSDKSDQYGSEISSAFKFFFL